MSEDSPINRARNLRKAMTPSEKRLWEKLRKRRFLGLRFLRQYLIIYQHNRCEPDYFIADFYCAEKKLVIEVDGKIHESRKEDDLQRDAILRNLGYRVFRIKNEGLIRIEEALYHLALFMEEL